MSHRTRAADRFLMAFTVVSCLIAGAVVLEGRSGIPQTFTAKTDLVALQVAVHDRKSSAVSNLGREAFRVFEDGLPQDIQFFISEDSPVAIGLVIDNSGSMWNKQQEVVAAAHAFARSSNPDDALFTVNFNERVWFGLPEDRPFTSDLAVLREALSGIQARGQTAMYEAVAAALDHVAASALEKRVLIVVSDGGDNRSSEDLAGTLNRAHQSNAVIYTVGIFDDLVSRRDRRALQQLADATGGIAFFPQRVSDVGAVMGRISDDIRHSYTIGYVSSNPRQDGAFRKVAVTAIDPSTHRRLQVRVRDGYLPFLNAGRR